MKQLELDGHYPDILINNAGISVIGLLQDLTEKIGIIYGTPT